MVKSLDFEWLGPFKIRTMASLGCFTDNLFFYLNQPRLEEMADHLKT